MLAWFLPSPRLYLSSFCFPVPVSHVLFGPCLDCGSSHPLFSYFHAYWLLSPGVLLNMCLVCNLPINVIPFNSCIYRGPADTLTHTTSPHCAPSFILFGCLPFLFEFCCAYFRFFCLLPLICLNSLTLRLFPNLYNCNHAMVYQPIGFASQCAS